MNDIVQIFKALSDETRLKILVIISRKKICAKGIARHLDISEASVSQHLKVLKDAGIIVGIKMGYYVHYSLQEPALAGISEFIDQLASDKPFDSCSFKFDMPHGCKAVCKANSEKCCEKYKYEGRK